MPWGESGKVLGKQRVRFCGHSGKTTTVANLIFALWASNKLS